MSEPYLAMITSFGCYYAVKYWALCNGTQLDPNANQPLYSLIGTIYGGDGRTSFLLPDLQDRFADGAGRGPGLSDAMPLGGKGGAAEHALAPANLPSHTHHVTASGQIPADPAARLAVSDSGGSAASPKDQHFAQGSVFVPPYTEAPPTTEGFQQDLSMTGRTVEVSATLAPEGQEDPIPVRTLSPYQTVTYQICIKGLYPSRA